MQREAGNSSSNGRGGEGTGAVRLSPSPPPVDYPRVGGRELGRAERLTCSRLLAGTFLPPVPPPPDPRRPLPGKPCIATGPLLTYLNRQLKRHSNSYIVFCLFLLFFYFTFLSFSFNFLCFSFIFLSLPFTFLLLYFSISSDAVVSECLTRQCALSTSLQCQQQLL